MHNSTYLLQRINNLILTFSVLLFSLNSFAEGTPTVSPNSTNITALGMLPDIGSGSNLGSADDNRIYFEINDNATENLYFGFDWRTYNAGSPARANNVYYKIYSPTGVVLLTALWNSTAGTPGSIDSYARAITGPNIGGVTTGYAPLTFDPSAADGNGAYWIEFYRSTDAGVTQDVSGTTGRAVAPYFDLTVALNSGAFTKRNGRVRSDKWSFVAVDPRAATFSGIITTASAEPILYSYTTDQTLIKIDFEAGFQPIAFIVAVNSYGVTPTGGFAVTRKSVYSATAPSLANGYHVFLNIPDVANYPIAPVPSNPIFVSPVVTGCGPYAVNFNNSVPGDVRLLLDLNGTTGFQAGTSDRILEAFDLVAGNNIINWDGKDGLGVDVASGANFNLSITFSKGRFNLPLYDAELNKNGVKVAIEAPIAIANAQMYWDDTAITNIPANPVATDCDAAADNQNNVTGTGIFNGFAGSLSPSHAWNGNGNPTNAIPAPAVAGNDIDALQCNDYGNVRIINTWGWGYTSASTNLSLVFGCADLSVVKTVSNSTPTFGSQVTFTVTVKNNGTANSINTRVSDILPNGYSYVSDNGGGTYNSASGLWNIGTLNNSVTVSLQITATVTGNNNYTNTASVSSDLNDPNTNDNSSSVLTTPTCNATIAPNLIKN